jgi:two-component system phosphate regulon sensor histidine kinase PhoR
MRNARRRQVQPAPVVDEDAGRRSLLPEVAATLSALDIPVLVHRGDDERCCSRTRRRKRPSATIPPNTHLSARLRSPGILDMVRETIVTNKANQIEHSERCRPSGLYRSGAPIDLGQPS